MIILHEPILIFNFNLRFKLHIEIISLINGNKLYKFLGEGQKYVHRLSHAWALSVLPEKYN